MISSEILALLRTGHASGGHARWRALHEVAVIASFLADHDQETSRRYLLHVDIDKFRLGQDHSKHAEALGQEPIEESAMEQLKARRSSLIKEFGRTYGGTYGWASHILGSPTRFVDIEEAVDLSKWRPYYRWASEPIHATAKGLSDDLGQMGTGRIHSEPSNAGFADPGQGMCISLNLVTVSFLLHSDEDPPDSGDLATLQVLSALAIAANDAFVKAADQLDRDEERAAQEREEETLAEP